MGGIFLPGDTDDQELGVQWIHVRRSGRKISGQGSTGGDGPGETVFGASFQQKNISERPMSLRKLKEVQALLRMKKIRKNIEQIA